MENGFQNGRGIVARSFLLAPFSRPFPKVDFWMHFGRSLAHFWLPFGSLWFPLGSPWLPFGTLWLTFGALWLPFSALGITFAHLALNFLTFGIPGAIFNIAWYFRWESYVKWGGNVH